MKLLLNAVIKISCVAVFLTAGVANAAFYMHGSQCIGDKVHANENGVFASSNSMSSSVSCFMDVSQGYASKLDVKIWYLDKSSSRDVECFAEAFNEDFKVVAVTNTKKSSGSNSGTRSMSLSGASGSGAVLARVTCTLPAMDTDPRTQDYDGGIYRIKID